ncbi:helix-turn-helix domain-containing protein [Listeria monocytogenes serotype 1/2b]|uniref:helix-turn-helix transcriptional regulator n=1 Tax=Listeria seeligeri TaxID=1640 RepID=UPI00162A7D9E|nr:helix-turn-helix domain-containing protein [Listeria seeligeri]EHC6275941.1 helix-turn-helix domain-containing protein [Listeria monocytogenes serotype 1/2b]MBC2071802.1 helix-turn-helix domain-containing protein [Listeria seeligeri]
MNKKLLKLVGEKKYTEIAKNLSISANYFGLIVSGKRTPSLEVAKEICDYFNSTVEEVFFNQKSDEMTRKLTKTGG